MELSNRLGSMPQRSAVRHVALQHGIRRRGGGMGGGADEAWAVKIEHRIAEEKEEERLQVMIDNGYRLSPPSPTPPPPALESKIEI
jgi:hypothetical protein